MVSLTRSTPLGSQPTAVLTSSLSLVGDITAAELGQVMRELGLNPSESELRDLVNEADLNNDGVISFEGACAPEGLPPHTY